MKALVLLLVAVGACSARTITWFDPPKARYGITLKGCIEEITGPNPYGREIGAPLVGHVEEIGFDEPWDGEALSLAVTFWGSRPRVHATPAFYFINSPLPWLTSAAPDQWLADIEPGGHVSYFAAEYGGPEWSVRTDRETGVVRFYSEDSKHQTLVSGRLTSIEFQQLPEPSTWMLMAPTLLATLALRRRCRSF
jgi:hypothetical protein